MPNQEGMLKNANAECTVPFAMNHLIVSCDVAVEAEWEVLASQQFVHAASSPSLLARALYLPGFSAQRNAHVQYVMLKQGNIGIHS